MTGRWWWCGVVWGREGRRDGGTEGGRRRRRGGGRREEDEEGGGGGTDEETRVSVHARTLMHLIMGEAPKKSTPHPSWQSNQLEMSQRLHLWRLHGPANDEVNTARKHHTTSIPAIAMPLRKRRRARQYVSTVKPSIALKYERAPWTDANGIHCRSKHCAEYEDTVD